MRNRSQQAAAALVILLVALTTIGAGLLLALSDNPDAIAEEPTATRWVIPTIGPSPTTSLSQPSPTALPPTAAATERPATQSSSPSPTHTPTHEPSATPHPTLYISPTLSFFVATLGPGPTQTTTTTDGACSHPNSTISTPQPGDVVSGMVTVRGSADFPDFAYYKFELRAHGTSAADYVTIYTGETPVEQGSLMRWQTEGVANGDYWLRLVVVDSTGNYPERCAIALTIEN